MSRADIPLPELQAVVEAMAPDRWRTIMAKAQRAALATWRDRKEHPGLAARFERSAYRAGVSYGYALRRGDARRQAANRLRTPQRPYHASGALATMMSKRKPKTKRSDGSGQVRSNLAIGGGALNFLGQKYPATYQLAVVRTTQIVPASSVGSYTTASGRTVSGYRRAAYVRQVTERRYTASPSGTSYLAEWANTAADQAWIAHETQRLFLAGVRDALFTKTGKRRGMAVDAGQRKAA